MAERIYYPINEDLAKQAHNMMSMSDYVEGSTTAGYRSAVDRAYGFADRVAEKKPEEAERAYRLAERYSKKMAEYYNKESSIGMMCPSVMISGAGNFPVKKKERQIAAWQRNQEFYDYIQGILWKIKNILYGKEIIKSDDENAVEKLEKKLTGLKENQEKMKAANKAIRMKDTEKGDAALRELGYTDRQIAELRKPDFCGRVGFPSYALTNNNQNIHRVENRLKALKAAKEQENTESENEHFRVIENTDIMRLQLFFDEKPDSATRDILKKNGFRWSPKNSCWQRQLTDNARYAMNNVLKSLEGER